MELQNTDARTGDNIGYITFGNDYLTDWALWHYIQILTQTVWRLYQDVNLDAPDRQFAV